MSSINYTGKIATWGNNPKEAAPSATCNSRNGHPSSTGYVSSGSGDYKK